MQVTINGTSATNLPANWEKDIHLAADARAVQGSVIDPGAGAARFLSRYRIVGFCFVVLVWLALLAMVAFARPIDREVLGPVAAVIAVMTPAAVVMVYFARRGRLYDSLPARAKRGPPPGTEVRVDSSGLKIGDHFAVWNDVTLDRVDFSVVKGRYGSRTYFVHQVDVRSNDFACTLDGLLLEDGQSIVAETFRHKYRPAP